MVVIVWWLDLQIPVQSVPISTKVLSLNPCVKIFLLAHLQNFKPIVYKNYIWTVQFENYNFS